MTAYVVPKMASHEGAVASTGNKQGVCGAVRGSAKLVHRYIGNRYIANRNTHASAMRLTARGRFTAFVLAIVVVICIGVFGATRTPTVPESTEVVSYIVQPGDTLWEYAEQITPQGGDVRDTVDELIALNNLDSSVLQAGQRLFVPEAL